MANAPNSSNPFYATLCSIGATASLYSASKARRRETQVHYVFSAAILFSVALFLSLGNSRILRAPPSLEETESPKESLPSGFTGTSIESPLDLLILLTEMAKAFLDFLGKYFHQASKK